MLRKVLLAAASSASLLSAQAAIAQDGGIWASRPKPHRAMVAESVPASSLPGLVPGLTVQTTDGKPVGVVTKVVSGSDGSIHKVMVVSRAGNMIKLSPTTLTVQGGIVITTQGSSGS